MNHTPMRTFWHGLLPTRTRQMPTGLRQEKWFYTIRNHRGNTVAVGERWLLTRIPTTLAARYLADWWADESELRPGTGWTLTCRPAWRVRTSTATIPAGWVVPSTHVHAPHQPATRRQVPHPVTGLLRARRTHRPVREIRRG